MDWASSAEIGNRVRQCEKCHLKIYNFSGMSMKQVESIIHANKEADRRRVYYLRPDRNFQLEDCPEGIRIARVKLTIAIAGFALLAILLWLGSVLSPATGPQ
jgi:hypothetical protein